MFSIRPLNEQLPLYPIIDFYSFCTRLSLNIIVCYLKHCLTAPHIPCCYSFSTFPSTKSCSSSSDLPSSTSSNTSSSYCTLLHIPLHHLVIVIQLQVRIWNIDIIWAQSFQIIEWFISSFQWSYGHFRGGPPEYSPKMNKTSIFSSCNLHRYIIM